mmetsp:Transcript_1807/g.3045  ORF Transcript_1807/g.3045 Transcript_1807/m.3045 type:complete len:124 (+) Transcript_1807:714-1085(+)
MSPGICPDNGCTESQNCSKEDLRTWAEDVCEFNCGQFGLTLYPDLTRTEPYNTANIACPNSFFDAPTLAEPAACQAKGGLPQMIGLTLGMGKSERISEDQGSSGSSLVWNSFAVICFLSVLFV